MLRILLTLTLFFVYGLGAQNLGNLKGKVQEAKGQAQQKLEQAQKDQKDETKHCICSQEATTSFDQCLAGSTRLPEARQSQTVGTCSASLRKGIENCQQICKKQNKLGSREWCLDDCTKGSQSQVSVCEKNFAAESCQGEPKCVRRMDQLRENCLKGARQSEESCKRNCG